MSPDEPRVAPPREPWPAEDTGRTPRFRPEAERVEDAAPHRDETATAEPASRSEVAAPPTAPR
ncbi:MAG: hypothetical protein ABIX10_08040, partial [Acidimicrobiales bacterium]